MEIVLKINYDLISKDYHKRYDENNLSGITSYLDSIVFDKTNVKILDVGTGTGYCLRHLHKEGRALYGLDLSRGMLHEAAKNNEGCSLIFADANKLPLRNDVFDLIISMNAIHQFGNPADFISSAKWLLNPEGALKIITFDPANKNDDWYVYKFFDNLFQNDIARYSGIYELLDLMKNTGFSNVTSRIIDRVNKINTSRDVLSDPFLQKNGSSQLASLSEKEYERGMERIKKYILDSQRIGQEPIFKTSISFHLVEGFKG